MTIQSDIVSLRFDCKHCGASLSLSIEDRLLGAIRECPSCHREWTVYNGTSYEKLFEDFSTVVRRIRDTVQGPIGCSMLVEVKESALVRPLNDLLGRHNA